MYDRCDCNDCPLKDEIEIRGRTLRCTKSEIDVGNIRLLLALCLGPTHLYADPRQATQVVFAVGPENKWCTGADDFPDQPGHEVTDEEAAAHWIFHQPTNGADWFRSWWQENVVKQGILERLPKLTTECPLSKVRTG